MIEEEPLAACADHLPPIHGCLVVTKDKMDALILGGASLVLMLIQK